MAATAKSKIRKRSESRKFGSTGGIRVYERLKALIISGEFIPGADLDEAELVRRFSVSRTPVREALIRLSMEGLVTMAPSRGAKVSSLNFSDVTDHLEIMDILTPSICYLAALRRTTADLESIKLHVDRLNATGRDELHERLDAIFELYTALGKATHNRSLSEAYRLTIYVKLRIGRISAARSETTEGWERHKAELQGVYDEIYDSISDQDAGQAQKAAARWMSIIRARLSSIVSSSPTESMDLQLQAYMGRNVSE
jgi:DNA-binding GntR family transcriptional regulator